MINNGPDFSVVIPVFRSGNNLFDVHKRVSSVLEKHEVSFEIIFVEDAGRDNSWAVIQQLCGQDKRVKGLKFNKNFGQHNALLAGIRIAKGRRIITMDDDLQHPPESLPNIWGHMDEGDYDVVYAPPVQEKQNFFRNLASVVTKIALARAMGAENARNICAFRIFETHLRNGFQDYKSPSVNLDVLLTWTTLKFGTYPVQYNSRNQGTSGYTFRKLVSHSFNMLTGFSTLPLKFASILGMFFTLFGGIILLFVLFQYFTSDDGVKGFTFLASIVSIFSGAQLLTLGIIGEYLGRMFNRTMERPAYFISDKENID